MIADVYLAGADPRTPLYADDGDLAALPSLLVQVGTREALLADARRFVRKARKGRGFGRTRYVPRHHSHVDRLQSDAARVDLVIPGRR